MNKNYTTTNFTETIKLGESLAKQILIYSKKTNLTRAVVLALEGDLGGGKTTFLQGFAKGMGIKEKITSPTFVIMKKFKTADEGFYNFCHIDCYRIQKPKEILSLGFKKMASNPQNIIAIEWSERIKKILPPKAVKIKFQFKGKNIRKISISNPFLNTSK